jgi:uncharacterized flavoprotein (TIGR03862 family)
MHNLTMKRPFIVAIIGAGPAGLMAAETIASSALPQAQVEVHVFDAMPSVGRKFLLAGRGGLNITHAESQDRFLTRYTSQAQLQPSLLMRAVEGFDANAFVTWVNRLGITTFVGSSGRIFPHDMKAAPLLRAWLARLKAQGVRFHAKHRLHGISVCEVDQSKSITLDLMNQSQVKQVLSVDACVLSLGGGSWAKLGSDGAWVPVLEAVGLSIAPLEAANCGFTCELSRHLTERYAGAAIKNCALSVDRIDGEHTSQKGEFVLTETGFEGQLIYALSGHIREQIKAQGCTTVTLDLKPDKTLAELVHSLSVPRGSKSLARHLQSTLNIQAVQAALLYEFTPKMALQSISSLAFAIKNIPIKLISSKPLDEAISSAGGIHFSELNDDFMLVKMPGVYAAGEMLDWEAPTGGYLLSACFATGRAAGLGVVKSILQASLLD